MVPVLLVLRVVPELWAAALVVQLMHVRFCRLSAVACPGKWASRLPLAFWVWAR